MLSKTLPGTNIGYEDYEETFNKYRRMVEVTGGLSLGQICAITGLQTSTIQNWVKRSYVPHPENKKYFERHISRILLISALKDCMNIEDVGELMVLINGDTDDQTDDIVDETRLYDHLCRIIYELDFSDLEDSRIEEVIEKVISEEKRYRKKLATALKVMTYAYVSGICSRKTGAYLQKLRKE